MGKTLYDYCMESDNELLLLQWDMENGGLTPQQVTSGSHRKVFWRCAKGHRWQAAVYTRTNGGSGCPYCTGRRIIPGETTLADASPELIKQWHPTKNPGVSPSLLSPQTHRRVWWQCEKGHEWQAQVNARVRGSGCPICANRQLLVGENDLATTHPELISQWHREKNVPLTPETVFSGSGRKVWWRCEKGHQWQAAVSTRARGSGCPVCEGKQVQSGETDLASILPELAKQWHPTRNGSLTPKDVTPYSNRKVWWQCEKGHDYTAVIAGRASTGSGCPYCTGRKVLAGYNDLETKHPAIAAQWHPDLNGALTPRTVTAGSRKKVWWQCAEGHVWKAAIYSRTGTRKTGCPVCAGKIKVKPRETVF